VIKKKRIRKLNPYKDLLPTTSGAFVACVDATDADLKRAGFPDDAADGTAILPNRVGRVSRYNAEGKQRIRRDMPMETAYRVVEWHWTEWHGRDKVEQSDFRDVPYKRYPREDVPPPSIELTLSKNTEGKTTVVSDLVGDWHNNEELLIHTINLFLEIFGECVVLNEDKTEVLPTNIQRVNWKLLPQGEYPFLRIKQELKPVLDKIKRGNRSFVDKRLERLNSFNPEYTVLGLGGFSGYVVMAYPDRKLFVLESLLYGNATYVLDRDWRGISQLTKAQILSNGLHRSRIIHQRSWFPKIKELFETNPPINH